MDNTYRAFDNRGRGNGISSPPFVDYRDRPQRPTLNITMTAVPGYEEIPSNGDSAMDNNVCMSPSFDHSNRSQKNVFENMYQLQGMPSVDTMLSPITSSSESSGSSLSSGLMTPYSTTSTQDSWHQNPNLHSPSVQAHAIPNPPWSSPVSSTSQFPFPLSSGGSLQSTSLPTQETSLAWHCEGDAMSVDVTKGYPSSRIDETDHQSYQSNNGFFQVSSSSHSASFSTPPMFQSNVTQYVSPSDHPSIMVNSAEYHEPNATTLEPPIVSLDSPAETGPYKSSIGSQAITQASGRRRKKSAAFHCPYAGCGRDFTAKHNLENHINSHLGIRNFECQWCGEKFGTKHVLVRHESKCPQKPNKNEQ